MKRWALLALAFNGVYLAGPGFDDCDDAVVLPDGDLLLACHSSSPRFAGAPVKLIQRRDDIDAFVVRWSPESSTVRWATRVGGSALDGLWRLRVAGDRVWAAGLTKSADLEVTAGAAQGTYGGGESDALLAAFALTDGRLLYASYFGGDKADDASDIIARDGQVHFAGATASRWPAAKTHGSLGKKDAYVARLGAWISVFGGEEDEKLTALEWDGAGALLAVGTSESENFPAGRFAAKFKGVADAMVVRLTPEGALNGGTFIGGEEQDSGQGLAVDETGAVYVTGITWSKRLPVKGKVYQRQLQGAADIFVAKLDKSLRPIWLTYFGGAGKDFAGYDGRSLALRANGDVVFAGSTESADLPLESAAQATYGGGESDGFLAVLTGDGGRLRYGTYWGGPGRDLLEGVALGPEGRVYATGIRLRPGTGFDATLLAVDVPQGFQRR